MNTVNDELASYKYLLRIIYDDLMSKTSSCDYCDDVLQMKLKVDRLVSELGIEIKLVIDNKAN